MVVIDMMTITILILLLQHGWNGYLLDDDLLLVLKPTILVAITKLWSTKFHNNTLELTLACHTTNQQKKFFFIENTFNYITYENDDDVMIRASS